MPRLLLLLQNPDDMYAELLEQLDVVEGQLPLAAVSHIKPKDRGMEGDKDKEKQQERERQKEREKAQAAKAQLAARGGLYVLICCMSCRTLLISLLANLVGKHSCHPTTTSRDNDSSLYLLSLWAPA